MDAAPGDRLFRVSSPALLRLRRLVVAVAFGAVVLLGAASLVERHVEGREIELLTASAPFADVGGAHIRYQLIGLDKPGPIVVFLNGMAASLEQWHEIEPNVAAFAPTLTYDRGGYGYSYGSSAHGAGEQADELAALLAKLQIDRPLVLVSYSVSASVARVFVARHRAMVAGVASLEPYLPELQGRFIKRGPYRSYYRWLVTASLSTFFGYRRWQAFLKARHGETVEPAALLRFSHWWAVDRELLATPRTQAETMGAAPLGNVPLLLLMPKEWESEDAYRELARAYAEFVKTSNGGSVRYVPDGVRHGDVVDDKRSCDVLVDAIRELTSQSR